MSGQNYDIRDYPVQEIIVDNLDPDDTFNPDDYILIMLHYHADDSVEFVCLSHMKNGNEKQNFRTLDYGRVCK